MAQTRKKRQRKRRGTQGGRVDSNRRPPRPRSRAEAKARARTAGTTRTPRSDRPPTWRGAFLRGLIAGAIFTVLLLVVFKRPAGAALGLGAFMLVFYVPGGYYFDLVMWRRRERSRMRSSGNS
jgi:hypothetical protein